MVTWNALIGGVICLFGLSYAAYGLLRLFGAEMASSPTAQSRAIARHGCADMVLGLFIAALTVAYLALL
jgi:hypothetical protein